MSLNNFDRNIHMSLGQEKVDFSSDRYIVASNGFDEDMQISNLKKAEAFTDTLKDSYPSVLEEPKKHSESVIISENIEMNRMESCLDCEEGKFIVYRTRFWILALFSYISFTMILVWATFSPILKSAEYAYGWTDGYIALIEGWGSIFSCTFMFPFNWMTQKYGLRLGMLTVCTMISIATGLRCITTSQKAFTYLASAGAMINGAASCLLLSLPAMVSVQWFPMNERATATAICTIATQLGIAGMYLSPLVVTAPIDDVTSPEEIRSDIHVLMFIYFGMAFAALVGAVIYFPAKPPTPPSTSSTLERVNYIKSIKMLLRNRDVVFVCFIYTFSLSIPFCWMSVMNLSLDCLGISQNESMWVAISASVTSSIATFIVARLTDRFHGHMKRSIAGLLFGSSSFFFWFLLMTEGVIVGSKGQVFVTIIVALSLQYSTVPLLIEFAVELAYPCPEIAVGAVLSFLLDFVDASFLLLLMINSECYRWLSYALVGATLLVIFPLMLVKEEYKRSELDIGSGRQPATTPESTTELDRIPNMPELTNISVPD